MNDFSQLLKELRAEKKIKQKDIAEILGISTTCYAGYEQGYREPSFEVLKKLAAFFDVSADYLLGLSDDLGAPLSSPDALPLDESQLLGNYRALSYAGKARAAAYLDLLREQEQGGDILPAKTARRK